jgi:hypothetical protein
VPTRTERNEEEAAGVATVQTDGPVTIAIAILTDHGRAWRKHPGLWAIRQVGTAPGTKYADLPCNRQSRQQDQQTDADHNLPARR